MTRYLQLSPTVLLVDVDLFERTTALLPILSPTVSLILVEIIDTIMLQDSHLCEQSPLHLPFPGYSQEVVLTYSPVCHASVLRALSRFSFQRQCISFTVIFCSSVIRVGEERLIMQIRVWVANSANSHYGVWSLRADSQSSLPLWDY
jgi:hypothetical protein